MFEPASTFDAPSTNQLTALRRAPAIEIETVLVRPMPTSSGSEEATPGTRVASWTKLRLLRGSSCTWRGPMSDWAAEVGWTAPAGRLRDLDRGLPAGHGERHVHRQAVVHVEGDAPGRVGAEAGESEADLVVAHRQEGHGVAAGRGGRHLLRPAGPGVPRGDGHPGEHRPRLVHDRPGDGCGRLLPGGGGRAERPEHGQKHETPRHVLPFCPSLRRA